MVEKKLLVTLKSDDEIDVKHYASVIEMACLEVELRPKPLTTKLDVVIQEIDNG